MTRVCVAAMWLCLAVPGVARAQGEPRASIAGGYVFLQQRPSGNFDGADYPVGWMATGAVRLGSGRLSAIGEGGLSYRTTSGDERQYLLGVFGGARFAVYSSRHLTLFAQGLAGLERFSEPGLVETGVAVQPGAGLDYRFSSRLFLRLQGDYRWSQPNDSTFHAYRVVGAIGVTLGKRE